MITIMELKMTFDMKKSKWSNCTRREESELPLYQAIYYLW